MIHPSQQAVDYIWNKFSECYLDQETLLFTQEWKNLKSAIDHKAFHPSSVNHQKFLKNTLIKLKKMNEKVDMSVENRTVKKPDCVRYISICLIIVLGCQTSKDQDMHEYHK